MFILVVHVYTCCSCLYLLLLMFILVAHVYTCCSCLYLLLMFILVAHVYTCCSCLYLLLMFILVAHVYTCCSVPLFCILQNPSILWKVIITQGCQSASEPHPFKHYLSVVQSELIANLVIVL